MVVLGHWLAVLVTWEDGTVTGENALNVVPDLWPLTWVFQVMPLFFFVGGFFLPATVFRGPFRVRALVCVR